MVQVFNLGEEEINDLQGAREAFQIVLNRATVLSATPMAGEFEEDVILFLLGFNVGGVEQ